jgi:hypothetical protein
MHAFSQYIKKNAKDKEKQKDCALCTNDKRHTPGNSVSASVSV